MGTAALPAVSQIAWAQTYPSRPVHFISGFPAGSAADIVARLVGQPLSERIGQSIVTENRPGAGGSLAAEIVVRAQPDGYMLLMATVANAINATLYPELKFNFVQDIAPVACIGVGEYVMLVNPSFPAKTVPEFIAYAKANPGKINMASPGNGTAVHVFGELFKIMTDIEWFTCRIGPVTCPIYSPGGCKSLLRQCPFRSSKSRPGSCAGWL